MPESRLNMARFRTLIVAAICFGLICLFSAFSVPGLESQAGIHQSLLSFIAFLCFGSVALAGFAYRKSDRKLLEQIALGLVGLAGLAVAEAAAWTFISPLLDSGRSAFRTHFAFLPLFYMGAVALLRTRTALKLCWTFWFLIFSITLAGVYFRLGMDLQRDGVVGLLVWVGLGNPLFLLVLHALPHYEDTLDQNANELADLRQRTGLVGKLEESDRRFNLVVDGLQVGVWDLFLADPRRLWCSTRLYELTGYSPGELDADVESLRSLIHPEDQQRVFEETTHQLSQGDVLDVELRLNTRHRGFRWFNSHAMAERDKHGSLIRLAGAIADVHDRRVAEQALHMTQAELTRMAYRDTLTDLHNRRYFDEHFKREWERARRSRQPLTLMLLDLDHFKSYNDRYGHPAGDLCLVEVAHLLKRATSRATDILVRLGGEEFGIVLPETTGEGAEEVAARLRQLLQISAIPNEGSPEKLLTVSIGYAVLEHAEGPSANEMYEQADRALYEVKRRGRNGVLKFWGKANLTAVSKEA